MRVAEYLVQRAVELGIDQAFLVTGGGAMYLNDAIGHTPGLSWLCTHHEQAAAMAAEGYARVTGRPALLNVTTGPGGINAINGVFGAWTDSIPMLVISGQVKRETMMATHPALTSRQLGDQEVDILAMVRGITKEAILLDDPRDAKRVIERAVHRATTGRPGPVWIDVPIDVQAAPVDPAQLGSYAPDGDSGDVPPPVAEATLRELLDRIAAADRPVVMVGSGVRLAHATELLLEVVRALGVPVVTAWTAIDAVPSDFPLLGGRPGTVGDRAGNFAVQNSDLLLVIGSRLNIRQVSYNWRAFARAAWIAQVDIDAEEMRKPTIRPQLAIHADAREFLLAMRAAIRGRTWDASRHDEWVTWVRARVARYPVVRAEQRTVIGEPVNPYHALDRLFTLLDDDDVVVCGDGSACVMTNQVAVIRGTQRLFTNSGSASMGYDLPAAIGAAVARARSRPGARVICLAGDGSVQLNLQELQIVSAHRLPIVLVVLNNGGYLSMRSSQQGAFGREIGAGPSSGISFPDLARVASAYELPYLRAAGATFEQVLRQALATHGPVVCELILDPNQGFEPKLSSRTLADGRMVSPALEDLAPFLDREELASNLLIPPWHDEVG
jgi:acetolactate synthase-1/2/3 large subunit